MSRMGLKFVFACLLLGFGIFYGVNMAGKGMEQVRGPIVEESEPLTEEKEWSAQEKARLDQKMERELRPPVSDKLIHRLANKTGELVHTTMHNGVEMIVSIFEKVIY